MASSPHNSLLLLVILSILLKGCIAIPFPSLEKPVVFGRAFSEVEIDTLVSTCQSSDDVKARFGGPTINFGPQRLFVYLWTVKQGSVFWMAGGGMRGAAGVTPLVVSHLFFIAFDRRGTILKTGISQFKPFDTITEQVQTWLSANDLAAEYADFWSGEELIAKHLLFVYQPLSSECPFPTFNANVFKPSVELDGVVVGDIAKGRYLVVAVSPGEHTVIIDPYPSYRYAGLEEAPFVKSTIRKKIPAVMRITCGADRQMYIETNLCTGTGTVAMQAVIQGKVKGREAIRSLK